MQAWYTQEAKKNIKRNKNIHIKVENRELCPHDHAIMRKKKKIKEMKELEKRFNFSSFLIFVHLIKFWGS